MLIWGEKSSGAVPFGTLFALCFLWFGISVPLVFVGSYFGYKKPAPEDPVRTNKIPRQIPEQPWYMNPVFSCLVGGVLPFGAVFIELFFILTSMWLHQVRTSGSKHSYVGAAMHCGHLQQGLCLSKGSRDSRLQCSCTAALHDSTGVGAGGI